MTDPKSIAEISRKYSYSPEQIIALEHQRKVCLIRRFARNRASVMRWYKKHFNRLTRLLAEEPQAAKEFFETTDLPWDIRDNIRHAARAELHKIRQAEKAATEPAEE